MKKIIYIALAAVLAAVSCAKTTEFDSVKPDRSGEGLTIRFTTGDMTRATTVDGVDNENLIKKIDYFIFPYNVDDEGNMVGTTEYVYKGTLVPEDGGLSKTYEATFAPSVLNDIFPNGATEAMVFAVANYVDKFGAAVETPNTTIPETAKTWADLHALEVGETFFKDGGPEFGLRWPRVMQPSPYTVTSEGEGGEEVEETVTDDLFFVMTGEEKIKLEVKNGYAVEAEIPLKRLASKVTVDFTYETVTEEKTSGNIYWIPQPSGEETRVYLSNAIEHTTLGGPLTRTLVADSWGTATKPSPGGDGTRDLFEYAYDFMNDIPATSVEVKGEDGETTTVQKKIAHYYTYPISMEEGDDNQPHLKLVLPWYGYKWVGEGDAPAEVDPTSSSWQMYKQKEVYYKIVLPSKTICDPNYIYAFSVNVNIIGSDKEVKIIGEEYVVKEWTEKGEVSSNVATGRYISLDIPKDEYNMYVDEIDIAFVSSGKVIPIVDELYQLNYGSATGVSKDYFMQGGEVTASDDLKNAKGLTDEDIKGWVTIPDNSSYLKIKHEMVNDISVKPVTRFDAAPYVYKITLHLEGADDFYDRHITITQYPAIYIEMETDTPFTRRIWNQTYYSGHVYINNEQSTDEYWDYVDYVSSPYVGTGRNANPNLYTITTTIPPASLGYIIGDPRKTIIDNLNGASLFANAVALYGDSPRRLSYYYPTDDSDQTRSMIAPKYMLPSSYGKNYNAISLDAAKQRCAAYQENGYPAGRWRVPTKSEIEYITSLSAKGFIPSLFNTAADQGVGSNYWSSHGTVQIQRDGTVIESGADRGFVRCVYDIWYWGNSESDKVDIDVFTWGDKLR